MEVIFIEAKSPVDISKVTAKALAKLPSKIGLVSTAQHKHLLDDVKNILESNGIKVLIGGQVIGCNAANAVKIKDKVEAFLYIGSGRFHPIQIQMETGKKVIMANPFTNEVKILEKEEIDKIKKQQKGALIRFLSSKEIGIIVSTKPGQEKMKKALELKKKIKDKNVYIFLADTINPAEFENFPFIESWINTACPRFADEKRGVVNYEMVEEIL